MTLLLLHTSSYHLPPTPPSHSMHTRDQPVWYGISPIVVLYLLPCLAVQTIIQHYVLFDLSYFVFEKDLPFLLFTRYTYIMMVRGTYPSCWYHPLRNDEGRCLLATCGRLDIIKCVFCVTRSACFVMYVCLQKCVFRANFSNCRYTCTRRHTHNNIKNERMMLACL